MAQKDAVEQLKDRFAKPLEEFEQRRVVFWHVVDGSFEDEFESLAKEGIPSERTVRFLKLSGWCGRIKSGQRHKLVRQIKIILVIAIDVDFWY